MNATVSANTWLRQGFAAQQKGDWAAAEEAYLQALQREPTNPDALQLLALLVRRRGDTIGAEGLMRRSLKAAPEQAHVWNNLGNLLDSTGRSDEALSAFDRALELKPSYADAHFNRARLLYSSNQLPLAEQALRRAVTAAGVATVPMMQLQAQIEADTGALDEALRTLDSALQRAPGKPALLHNRATILQRQHRYAEALLVHEQCQQLGLDQADAHYNRGNTFQSLGRHADAVQSYRSALRRDPLHRLALNDLARLRWRMGDADFDTELRHCTQAEPASALGPGLMGDLLLRAERYDAAAWAFREAARRAPDVAAFHDGLGRCLMRVGDTAGGLAAQAQALKLAPLDAALHTNLACSLLLAQRPEAACLAAEQARRLSPLDQNALAVLGLAWRVLDDPREAWLNNYAALVSVVDLDAPAGSADSVSFNMALAEQLQVLHTDTAAPVDQTLRHGTQTLGNLFDQKHSLVDALKDQVSLAVDAYVASLPSDNTHPFLCRRTAAWRYTDSWSSRLLSGGFHTNHVHPHGWLSAVYYVAVPPPQPATSAVAHEGWLQLGQPDIDVGLPTPVRCLVEPRPGRLVLFPSMVWHGTVPFKSLAHRLSVAFDAVPC